MGASRMAVTMFTATPSQFQPTLTRNLTFFDLAGGTAVVLIREYVFFLVLSDEEIGTSSYAKTRSRQVFRKNRRRR